MIEAFGAWIIVCPISVYHTMTPEKRADGGGLFPDNSALLFSFDWG